MKNKYPGYSVVIFFRKINSVIAIARPLVGTGGECGLQTAVHISQCAVLLVAND